MRHLHLRQPLVLTLAALLTLAAAPARAKTLTVTSYADDGAGTLRQAIADANADYYTSFDTIDIQVTGTITLQSQLQIDAKVAIVGPGAKNLTISGSGSDRVMWILHGSFVSIEGVTIANGNASSLMFPEGGAIYNSGFLTLTHCEIVGNAALEGGGIFNDATLWLVDSTVSANSAASAGGGISTRETLVMINSTISGNSAVSFGGGGIYNGSTGTVQAVFSTIANNSSRGIYTSGLVQLKAVILANNGPTNCNTPPVVIGSVVSTDSSCGFYLVTQATPSQLNLAPLADYGGATRTHALIAPSAATDVALDCTDLAGNAVDTDQRGVLRPVGPACDAGAFEGTGTLTVATAQSANGAGPVTFKTSAGSFRNLSAMSDAGLNPPNGATFPYGLFNWTISGLTKGQTITVTMTFPAPIATGANYYKYEKGVWLGPYDTTTKPTLGDDDGDNVLTLTITDGGPGDADAVDGEIGDPGGIALGAAVHTVSVDVKPGSFPNVVNIGSRGVVPVAILTTDAFDATTVDPLSVAFGPSGAPEAHGRGHFEDVDGDGRLDLVLHFDVRASGLQCGDTSASLTGKTWNGHAVQGTDSIQTICK
jgi:hypothetical protein